LLAGEVPREVLEPLDLSEVSLISAPYAILGKSTTDSNSEIIRDIKQRTIAFIVNIIKENYHSA